MPQTPSKLTMKIKGQNTTLTLLNEGEINFLKSPGLTEITLTLLFPMLSGKQKPSYYLNVLEKFKINKNPIQFILTRTSPNGKLLYDTNLKVSVEDYTITEEAANGLDVSVDIKLKQYRDFGTKTLSMNTASKATVKNERSTSSAPKANTYTVKQGDTLWSIAKKYYGDGTKYAKIYDANKDKVNNPNLIYAGQVLTIP